MTKELPAATSLVDEFLASVASESTLMRGNLIFGIDATASRERTWDTAAQLQASMFRETGGLGGLDVQLVYYRGPAGLGGECKASPWVDDPLLLTRLMGKIRCDAGETQIGKVLNHAIGETSKRKINAVIFVGDACEEYPDTLIRPARQLAALGVPVFMFQEGHEPFAEEQFREIARITRGAFGRFDSGSAKQLGELLKAVAVFASGGVLALEKQGSDAARLLLRQVR